MSRDGRDDSRADAPRRELDRLATRVGMLRRPGVPTDHLILPRTTDREVVEYRHREYHLRGSETRILATVGAFRVVVTSDLDARSGWSRECQRDLRHLADQGLIGRESGIIRPDATQVAVLTREAKALLDAHQQPHPDGRQQQYYAGLVKPREIAHDAQVYGLYEIEAARIDAEGGRVMRIVIDDELKRDYQSFLQRQPWRDDADPHAAMRTFAKDRALPIIDGHLELPDVRIEYETADGRHLHRDAELVTEHYSRQQVAGKARAGFALYRAVGAGRRGGASARAGGSPLGPHNLEWLR
jgi:DNA-binding Lrp family transcriptional regulator